MVFRVSPQQSHGRTWHHGKRTPRKHIYIYTVIFINLYTHICMYMKSFLPALNFRLCDRNCWLLVCPVWGTSGCASRLALSCLSLSKSFVAMYPSNLVQSCYGAVLVEGATLGSARCRATALQDPQPKAIRSRGELLRSCTSRCHHRSELLSKPRVAALSAGLGFRVQGSHFHGIPSKALAEGSSSRARVAAFDNAAQDSQRQHRARLPTLSTFCGGKKGS